MACEIEFLPVGKASKGGDAIIVRTGSPDFFYIQIIDGGDAESGKALVEHVKTRYGAQCIVSDVIATHSDADHISGMREIVAELDVRNVWIHQPWLSASSVRPYLQNKSWTDEGLARELRNRYDLVDEVVRIASERNIPVYQPFAGATILNFKVLSPAASLYPLLVAQFDRTPAPDVEAIKEGGCWIAKGPTAMDQKKTASSSSNRVSESWTDEKLREGGCTQASNESSVVLYGDFGPGKRVLLTGDAGNWGLTRAAAYAERNSLPLCDFTFVQIPHHGSRRNVSPSILNRLIGKPVSPNSPIKFNAFVSTPMDDATHPRKMVLNAFTRRGGFVLATQGKKIVHYGGFPLREDYSASTPLPLSLSVEDYD